MGVRDYVRVAPLIHSPDDLEYECRLVSTPESVIHGRCYISTSFLSFHAEGHGKYILVMLPFQGIQSLQKAVITKPPPGIPSNYPPQFHIVVGGTLPASVTVCEESIGCQREAVSLHNNDLPEL